MNGLLEEEPPLINTNQNSKIYFTLIYGNPPHIKNNRHDSTKSYVAIQKTIYFRFVTKYQTFD